MTNLRQHRIRVSACECITPLGDSRQTQVALCEGRRSLELLPPFEDSDGRVPLSLFEPMLPALPPRWFARLAALLEPECGRGWGMARTPIFISSSNFGIDSLYYCRRLGRAEQLPWAAPHASVEHLRREMAWGANVALVSHACVSAQVALYAASNALAAGAERALVLSYDFLSPFVAGGFHALKILNSAMPRPYHAGGTSSIGLGEGAAYAVLEPDRGDFVIEGQGTWNEMHHFTANQPDGSGFRALAEALEGPLRGRKAWIKGHGTGTLESGRLEAEALEAAFPDAPLTGWKGAIGHTLGSCGLVELAIACRAMEGGHAPGTVGSEVPFFAHTVALDPFSCAGYDAALLLSNAFGGAHAGLILAHA